MLLITIASVIAETILIFIIYSPAKAWRKALLYIDLLIMLSGYICYVVKTGGYRASFIPILLFSDSLRDSINDLSISYYSLYSVIQTTRLAFPFLILLTALEVNHFQPAPSLRTEKMRALAAFPPVILWALLLRKPYFIIFKNIFTMQNAMQLIVIIYMVSYSIAAIALMTYRISNTYLSWYRKQHTYSLISMISLLCIYFIFSIMDPILLIQDYSTIIAGPYSYFINYKIGMIALIGISMLIMLSATANIIAIYKDAKIELSRTSQEMTISRTMKETEMLTRGLLHSLKNRLLIEKVIALELQDMLNEGMDSDDIRKAVSMLIEEQDKTAEHMDRVHRTLKDIETHLRLERTQPLFDDIRESCSRKYNGHDISFSIESGAILADRELLKEAIMNMIDNSVDSGADRISISEKFTKSECIIEIADNGCGIDRNMRKRIFLPFATTKNMQDNWGFGLCFARQIVKKHLGDIQFHSEEGHGTTFYILLPKLY